MSAEEQMIAGLNTEKMNIYTGGAGIQYQLTICLQAQVLQVSIVWQQLS